ncbi:hypothetical protein EJB05_06281, partial [Eragrostis curvula]
MGKQASVTLFFFILYVSFLRVRSAAVPTITAGTDDGMERWGYVEVWPKAHMFWWYYKSPQRSSAAPGKPWPTVLWLQGGPGASGVGIGNFLEMGPLDSCYRLMSCWRIYGVDITVYNGQLDVICSTIGAESWVQKLKWDGLSSFLSAPRQPLYCGPTKATKAFVRSYKNLHFYWILGSGHFVPYEQPCIALSMIGSITQSPAS